MKQPTILVAEDEFLIRDGYVCPLLAPHFDIVAAVGDGGEAVEAAEQHRPAIVLLDISLPGVRGFEAARRILASQPDCKVLFVSNYAERALVEEARAMGASGYVLKARITSELIPAIQTALAGQFYQSVF